MQKAILALNAGSSSLKFGLYEAASSKELRPVARGAIDLGTPPALIAKASGGSVLLEKELPGAGLEELVAELVSWIDREAGGRELAAVGHRIVHGGSRFSDPVLLTPEIIEDVEKLTPLAPLHQPRSVAHRLQLARPVVCARTRLHADEARGQIGEERSNLVAPQLLAKHDLAVLVHTWTWNMFLARSRPTVVMCMVDAPSGSSAC